MNDVRSSRTGGETAQDQVPRRGIPWVVAAAVVVGATAIVVGVMSDHRQIRVVGHPESIAFVAIIGASLIASGLVARARGLYRFGGLMVASGFAWFLAELTASNNDLGFSIGLFISTVWLALFFHALMSFPNEPFLTGPALSLVLVLYGLFTVVQFAWLYFADSVDFFQCADCPQNLIGVVSDPELASAILLVQQPLAAVISVIGGALVLSRRWIGAGPYERRTLTPVHASGIACLVIAALVMAVELFWEEGTNAASWISGLAFSAVPAAFLVGILRQRLDRTVVGAMVVQLNSPGPLAGLRDMIATALRDPTLELAYWLPEEGTYVDAKGLPVELTSKDEGRAVTYVNHGEDRVAALIHDPRLDGGDELVREVCAAAALSLANERLQAELRARLQELRASRARIVRAGDAERRRVERNLHDGAQQQLLSISLSLQSVEKKVASDRELLNAIRKTRDELGRIIEDLRDLAQGLHPAVLIDHGWAIALKASVARSSVPTELRIDREDRLPAQIEIAGYYVVTEALANIAKHARASRASVNIHRHDGTVVIEVVDDGIGGANFEGGTGLLGLSDRVGALDGRLEVNSQPGGGTTVRAVIPCV